ncbi:hypothetical protein DPEC_G00178720, partial [Dallia pectoralis]
MLSSSCQVIGQEHTRETPPWVQHPGKTRQMFQVQHPGNTRQMFQVQHPGNAKPVLTNSVMSIMNMDGTGDKLQFRRMDIYNVMMGDCRLARSSW